MFLIVFCTSNCLLQSQVKKEQRKVPKIKSYLHHVMWKRKGNLCSIYVYGWLKTLVNAAIDKKNNVLLPEFRMRWPFIKIKFNIDLHTFSNFHYIILLIWLILSSQVLRNLIVDEKHKVVYCFIPKVACSNWKRFLLLQKGTVTLNETYK